MAEGLPLSIEMLQVVKRNQDNLPHVYHGGVVFRAGSPRST